MTRTVQQLQKSGYVTRVPDPDDRRAQRIELTATGREAIASIREADARGMQLALANWSPEELRELATLFHHMVDEVFLGYAEEDAEQPGCRPHRLTPYSPRTDVARVRGFGGPDPGGGRLAQPAQQQ